MDRRLGTPCRVCGQRPASGGKVVRWAEGLKDAQVVELAARLSRTLAQTIDIDPTRLRQAIVTFVRGEPA